MKVAIGSIPGMNLIEVIKSSDERGSFSNLFSRDRLLAQGLDFQTEQVCGSVNKVKGTLRGLHYQAAPHEEAKLVHCLRGALFDIVLDLRPESPAFGNWCGVNLHTRNPQALYIPEGCAHGFQTQEDDTEVLYQLSASYYSHLQRGIRWNDSRFQIEWPMTPTVLSTRDAGYADFQGDETEGLD